MRNGPQERSHSPADERRWLAKMRRAARLLEEVLAEARAIYPREEGTAADGSFEVYGANWYLALDSLNLMRGPSHTGSRELAQRQNVICTVQIYHSAGGDW